MESTKGKNETVVTKKGYSQWRLNPFGEGYLCKACFNRETNRRTK